MRKGEDDLHAFLPKDVDLPRSKLALVGADGEELLNGIVSEVGDLTVDAKVLNLQSTVSLRLSSDA